MEASKLLGVSQDYIRWLAWKDRIKAQKLGRDWVILELKYKSKWKRKSKGDNYGYYKET